MKIILACGAMALATAAGAQTTPPTTGSPMNSGTTMPHDSTMPHDMTMPADKTMPRSTTTTTPRTPATTRRIPAPRSNTPVTTPSQQTPRPMQVDNMGNPRTAPQPNPVNNPQPGRNIGATQPAPRAGPDSTGIGEYPICTPQLTDRCVNPNDIRRGIAKRPSRR